MRPVDPYADRHPLAPYYRDEWFTLYWGDNQQLLRMNGVGIANSIDCVVTSPPYYGLRDYGTGTWIGGSEACEHGAARRKTRYDYSLATSPIQDGTRTGTDAQAALYAPVCPDCGAKRSDAQLGLEETVGEYIDKLVALFVTMGPLLKQTATVWVNLGDSYIDRELTGIPWQFAFKMKQYGFTLLSDCIWYKPNPQPTSQKHRPSVDHEYIFLFAISERSYYGFEDVKLPMAGSSIARMQTPRYNGDNKGLDGNYAVNNANYSQAEKDGWRNLRTVWEISTESFPGAHYAVFPRALVRQMILAGCPEGGVVCDPFMGSGTTAVVARSLARRCLGTELKADYCRDAVRRYQGRNLVLEQAGQISLYDLEVSPESTHDHDGHRQPDGPTAAPQAQPPQAAPAPALVSPQEGEVGGEPARNPWRAMALPGVAGRPRERGIPTLVEPPQVERIRF